MRYMGIGLAIIALVWTLPACSSGDDDKNSTSGGSTTGVDRSECSPNYPPYVADEPEPEPVLNCNSEIPCEQYSRRESGGKSGKGLNFDCMLEVLVSEQPSPAKLTVLDDWVDGSSVKYFHTGYSGRRVIWFGKMEDWMGYITIYPFYVCTLAETLYLQQCLTGTIRSDCQWLTNCHPIETGICPSESCINGTQDGTESDIDCGGSCLACAENKACNTQSDCYSDMSCENGKCAIVPIVEPPVIEVSCDNQIQDGDETDVDCGGSCPKKCENGQKCGWVQPGVLYGGIICKSGCCRRYFCDHKLIAQPELIVCVPFADTDGDGHCDEEDYCSTAVGGKYRDTVNGGWVGNYETSHHDNYCECKDEWTGLYCIEPNSNDRGTTSNDDGTTSEEGTTDGNFNPQESP
ncbi:MAG TPA: hypothetical protein EYN06_06020 [Myxococcales bacterium]|nr:hypothetical protein [Myxococcales bacterium]